MKLGHKHNYQETGSYKTLHTMLINPPIPFDFCVGVPILFLLNSVLNLIVVVGAFPVIVQLHRLIVYTALVLSVKCSVTEFYWQRYEILYRRRHNIATLWMTLSTWEEEIRTLFCKERSIHSANTPFFLFCTDFIDNTAYAIQLIVESLD